MRILHIAAKGARRGAEMFAADLAGALARMGVEQRVAVLSSDGPIAVPFPVPTEVAGGGGWRIPGFRVRAGTVQALRALIRRWRPDVVQVHGGEPLKYAVLATGGSGPPLIYRRIGAATYGNRSGPRRVAHARLMRRAACVVAVAEAVRREMLDVFHLPDDRVVTIPNAVDSDRLRPVRGRDHARRALGIERGRPVILSLGALTWEKDPLTHVAVADRVRRAHDGMLHLIVGDGPLRRSTEERVRALGLGGHVRVLGARDDTPDLLTASDVLLLASRTEGMPGVVIEAGMMGVSVAAFRLAGVPEVVEHEVTGYLSPAGNVDALAEGVIELLSNPARRQSMGMMARERCRTRFDIRAVAPRYLDLYQRVATRPSTGTIERMV